MLPLPTQKLGRKSAKVVWSCSKLIFLPSVDCITYTGNVEGIRRRKETVGRTNRRTGKGGKEQKEENKRKGTRRREQKEVPKGRRG